MAKAKLEFRNDVQDDLPVELHDLFLDVKAKYNAHKDAAKALPTYAAHKDAQAAFEAELTTYLDIPAGKVLVCTYNFGKLGIALKDAAKAKAKAPKGSLSDWIAARAASGVRV